MLCLVNSCLHNGPLIQKHLFFCSPSSNTNTHYIRNQASFVYRVCVSLVFVAYFSVAI